ncbi:hypothetical protein, partial [Nocardioides sp.]|uniref:hypothetical protein n=1 Tax=Nocardioides sp. TaxID=35761 RepID=UPI002B266247
VDRDTHRSAHVRRIVAAEGGDDVITSYHRRLVELRELRPDLIEVRSVRGDLENTYGAVLRAVGGAP